MSLIILTYDVQKTTNTIHTEVKNALIAMGYSSYVPLQGGGKVGLPNTTLVKDGTTPQQAATDIKNVCRSKSAVLEKYITLVTSYSDGRAEVLR